MALIKFYKQSYEEFAIAADFSINMVSGETVSTLAITAIDNAGDSATVDILSNPQASGQNALIKVLAGTGALSPYKITFKVVTSTANKWELDVLMKVKEL